MASRSSDDDRTPLLSEEENAQHNTPAPKPTFASRVTSVVQEPLTDLTKVLLVIALILLLLSSIFIGLFAGVKHKLDLEKKKNGSPGQDPPVTVTSTWAPSPTGVPGEKACLTAECIVLSANVLLSLDQTQDPCENFYDFASGGWLKSHPLPADKGIFGTFNVLSVENKQIIQEILEANYTTQTPSHDDAILLEKLQGLHGSCMNEDKLEALGQQPLLHFVRIVRNLFRGDDTEIESNELDKKKKARNGLTAALAYMHSRGLGGLFSFQIEGDVVVDPDYMALWFHQPDLGLPSKEYYNETTMVELYQTAVGRVLYALADEPKQQDLRTQATFSVGNKSDEDAPQWPPWPFPPWDPEDGEDKDKRDSKEKARKLAKQVVEFESKLAEASLDPGKLYLDPFGTYNPVPLHNLTTTIPQINFENYFATYAPRTFPNRVIMSYPAYAVSLAQILNDTSSDVVEAYLITRAAWQLNALISKETEVWKAIRAVTEELTGIKKGAIGDRGEYCIGVVEESLGFAAGRFFVEKTFPGDSKKKGTKVIKDIIHAFKDSLAYVKWMDKESATAAAEKADALDVKVGYPTSPNTTDASSLVRYYGAVHVNPAQFFESMLSVAVSDEMKAWQKLGRRRDHGEWEMYPSMVNAYYNPPANEIVFPAGILRPPFFSQEWPAYMAYGAFGHVAAHELTHAFDSSGRLYNQQGKLEPWWTNATSDNFQVLQDCIIEQYSGYTVDDGKGGTVHVNGNLTSPENIGDTGLIQAYRAWKAQYSDSLMAGNEFILPGLDFTKEQLFFISFGRIWAQNIKPASAVQRVRTDPHSPNRYRVDGTVANIPEFAQAFNCSKDAKLNPPAKKQCRFW